ncbi:conjugal transfer protein MobC [Chitinophaga niabensis]|uniref:TraM recognition site of TraD and TraG n=1 Tax=Chitinophaga niabensis TaxID=536979 RepID=A0A1N6KAF9_9BACT|nr:conjugal transfer protein MobC [Chitinophaga niabensis]SIO53542.1 TraM recognition site of TraD and TraG [Chitinophaga niabensis]
METGENIQELRKILDFIRFGSILLLLIHFYSVCFPVVYELGWSLELLNRVIFNLSNNFPILSGFFKPKLAILLLLCISLLGVKGRKDEKLTIQAIVTYLGIGMLFYLSSTWLLQITAPPTIIACLYVSLTSTGYVLILTGGTKVSRFIKNRLDKDVFNDWAEQFPQEERLLSDEYSVNLPTEYKFRDKIRKGWINIQTFRACIVSGTPGSGKSFWVVRNYIQQLVEKQFCFFLYDFKFPDLTLILYNHALKHAHKYPVRPQFFVINFDDLSRTHRCNVLYPETMLELTDASESSQTLMLALNRDWIKKISDFFVQSCILFVTAIFWFLKKYDGGRYCTLPHAIELAQMEYDELFPVLSMEREIEVLINPFISAYLRGANEQLEGQIASAKISLARLVSPSIYYVLTGSDFTLNVNNPESPKIVSVGNNPAKQSTYGAVISLYVERMHKLINKKNQQPCALIYDEYPTLTASVDLISTARSNRIAVLVGLQDMSQMVRDYGKEQAEVIMNICGNIISGQVLGDSAKALSERIGRINQLKESFSISANDTSISKSTQLESAIPVSRISNLSSGEFVGAVADTPQQPIKNKVFHARIINDIEAIKKEEAAYKQLPIIRNIDEHTVMENFYQVKRDARYIIDTEMNKIRNSPTMKHLIKKSKNNPPPQSNISL